MNLEDINIYISLTPKEVDTLLHALKSEENYLSNLYDNIQKKAQGQIDNYLSQQEQTNKQNIKNKKGKNKNENKM